MYVNHVLHVLCKLICFVRIILLLFTDFELFFFQIIHITDYM